MKLTTLLLFITSFAFGQELMLVEVTKTWPKRADIEATPGKTYSYTLGDDSARYFIPPAGKTIKATIKFEEVGTAPSTTETVDATRETTQFSGSWTAGATSASGWLGNTIAYSNIAGETAKFNFTGTGIEVYAEKKPGHGTGTITLTKGTQIVATTSVNFNAPLELPAKIFEKKNLQRGDYTLTLTVGTGYSLLDYFVVHK
jgi:hypothetical protein